MENFLVSPENHHCYYAWTVCNAAFHEAAEKGKGQVPESTPEFESCMAEEHQLLAANYAACP